MADKDAHKPLVSVIMPVRNGERFLKESMMSVLDQDYPSLELIVVDGQSADGTGPIAKSFKEVKYIYQEDRLGIGRAKNLGIAEAEGEFIAFISHDDLWSPHKLTTQVDYMIRHPGVQYTITRVKFFLEPGCSMPLGFKKELLNDDYVGKMPETLVSRRSVFDSIGGFNTEYTYIEDVEWFARADRNRIPMAVIPEVLLYKRIHGRNVSYDISRARDIKREVLDVVRKSIRDRTGSPNRNKEQGR